MTQRRAVANYPSVARGVRRQLGDGGPAGRAESRRQGDRGVAREREGLKQISDAGTLERIVGEILAANPKQVEQYKGGKTSVFGFFVGQVMKATRGQANPALVNQVLKDKLA